MMQMCKTSGWKCRWTCGLCSPGSDDDAPVGRVVGQPQRELKGTEPASHGGSHGR